MLSCDCHVTLVAHQVVKWNMFLEVILAPPS